MAKQITSEGWFDRGDAVFINNLPYDVTPGQYVWIRRAGSITFQQIRSVTAKRFSTVEFIFEKATGRQVGAGLYRVLAIAYSLAYIEEMLKHNQAVKEQRKLVMDCDAMEKSFRRRAVRLKIAEQDRSAVIGKVGRGAMLYSFNGVSFTAMQMDAMLSALEIMKSTDPARKKGKK